MTRPPDFSGPPAARRIPWQRLLMLVMNTSTGRSSPCGFARFWKSRIESSDWLVEILQNRCPGFLETEKALTPKAAKTRPLVLRLEDWIDDHVFGFAKQEGSFFASTYYAVRDPRYQRAEVCWSECTEKWKKAKPIQYPSFEEWKGMAAQCDETAHLTARERKARASAKLVHPDRLTEAATRYMDCEALAYWARQALERGSEPPAEVVRELERRCPGYLDAGLKAPAQEASAATQEWQRLMLWIADHLLPGRANRGLVRCHSHSSAEPSAGHSDHGIRRPL